MKPHHLYSCPGWLHALASSGRLPDAYLTAGDRGVLPVYRRLPTLNARYASATLFRNLPGPVPTDDFCYAGAMSAYQSEVPTRLNGQHDDLAILLDEAEHWSGGPHRLLMPYLTDRTASALPSHVTSRLVLENFEAWSPPGVSTLSDLVAALPRKQRQNVRRNQRDFARSGLVGAVETLSDCISEFAPLADGASRKHDQRGDISALKRHLEAIAATFATDAVVFTARDGDAALVGAVLGIFHGEELYLRMTGFDEERSKISAAYFNLSYYLPLSGNLGRLPHAVHYGTGSLVMKLHQGAVLSPLWTLMPVDLAPDTRALVQRQRLADLTAGVPESLLERFTERIDADRH